MYFARERDEERWADGIEPIPCRPPEKGDTLMAWCLLLSLIGLICSAVYKFLLTNDII